MKLTTIAFQQGDLTFTIEESGDNYWVDISYGENETLCHFRTDEINTEDLIKGLEYFKNYNFIQGD